MWGRLKRRIMRSKTGGVYDCSQDEGYPDSRDSYRDFRKELYTESRENVSWKEGKSGKKLPPTKAPFPNLDRCSCGTPGGKNPPDTLVRSETLRRKSDFIIGAEDRSKDQRSSPSNKTNNEYTSTSTGPGSRPRALDGGDESPMRGSTSTGQIPQALEEQVVGGGGQRPNGRLRSNGQQSSSVETRRRRRRVTYSDDDIYDDDDDDEAEHDEDDDDNDDDDDDEEEEEEQEKERERLFPSALKSLRNASQSGGAKSSSTSSDYTSLAFDLNYVKVSPPKLRRRRKKTSSEEDGEETSKTKAAPLMVRRERPIPTPAPHHPPPPVAENSPDGVDAGAPNGTDATPTSPHGNRKPCQVNDVIREPANCPLPSDEINSRQQFGYISWGEGRPMLTQTMTPGAAAAAADAKEAESIAAEPVTRTKCDISTSGSLLQFTFTVRLDNDVIRGSRRNSEQSAPGSSLVSGRVDILSSAGFISASEGSGNGNQAQEKQQETEKSNSGNTGSPPNDLNSRTKHEKETKTTVRFSELTNPGSESTEEGTRRSRDGADGESRGKSQTTQSQQRSLECSPTVKAAANRCSSSATGNAASDCRQQTPANSPIRHGTSVTTTAIVHKSASDIDREEREEEEEERTGNEKRKAEDLDSNQVTSKPLDDKEEKGFDEVDFAPRRQQTNGKPSKSLKATYGEAEQTHMNWDEVLEEAHSLGIPLTRPAAHCIDCHKDRSTGGMQCLPSSTTKDSPSKHSDGYWVCSSCSEALQSHQHSSSSSSSTRKSSSKTSSPFKEKFKLQTIFGSRRTKEEKTGRAQEVVSYPPSQRHRSPSGKYRTMPPGPSGVGPEGIAHSSPDIQKCVWSVSRTAKQPPRGRSMSPALTVRCGTSSSPKASNQWRGDTRGQQRISHLCSPPQLRCRFACGRTIKLANRPSSASNDASVHISTDVLSSSPAVRRPNTIDRDFLKSLAQLMGCSWYWGSLSFESAEVELSDRPDGCFLVRDSSDERYILSISFRSLGSTHHIRIERYEGLFSFSSEQSLHESSDIIEFIERAIEISQDGQCLYYLRPRSPISPPVPVLLLYPLSRFAH